MQIELYYRKAHYYETDQMGVIHHANYIHWFEEARVAFMEAAGFGYKEMEERGVASPVLAISCEYKKSLRFDDTAAIRCRLAEFDGVRMSVEYEVYNSVTKESAANGRSRHCFIGRNGRPVSLKKAIPELYALFGEMVG